MLENALDKEQNTWRPFTYNSQYLYEDEEVDSIARDESVRWLFALNKHLSLNPETAVLSANILDSFLCLVKARPKYLRCIAVTCLLLAAKVLEEDEVIPSVEYLVKVTMCGCSVADIVRMEKIILNKLQWNLGRVTALDFLYILHGIIVCEQPNLLAMYRDVTAGRQLSILIQKLLICQESSEVVTFQPSTQALALISLELGLCTRNWLALTVMLQKLVQADQKELIQCREAMSTAMRFASGSLLVHRHLTNKRKVEQLQEEEEDIYDSIKRLYGEDSMSYESMVSCAHQAITTDEPQTLRVSPLHAIPAV